MLKIIFIIVISMFVVGCSPEIVEGPGPYDEFAKCIEESNVKMYGSYLCSACKSQRRKFGSSFHYIGEIECHPRGKNPHTELCLEKKIEKTPTWILEKDGEEVKRLVGLQSMEDLAQFSGCVLDK